MKRSGAFRQQVVVWCIVLGFWALLVLAFAGQLVITADRTWTEALFMSAHDWYPWILFTPAIVWLSTRFPIERQKLWVSIPIHIAGCVVAAFLCFVMTRPLPRGANPPEDPQNPQFAPGPQPPPPFGPGPRRLRNPPAPEVLPRLQARRQQMFVNRLVMFSRANIPIYWIIVSITHALTFYRRSQERERKALELEARLADARLQALRMQLHPHFLFNTLNAISTLVHKDANAADEMIANLSELLRTTLDTTAQEIPLRRELEFLDRYLEIQQVRFRDRLRLEKAIDATALDGLIPTLILQPLAENAVRHGIEPGAAAGFVRVSARRDDKTLRVGIHDSGPGPKEHTREQAGIGLANTKARLKELYGDQARLVFNSSSEGGFAVELEIPFHENPVSPKPAPEVAS